MLVWTGMIDGNANNGKRVRTNKDGAVLTYPFQGTPSEDLLSSRGVLCS
jgi:hypothetical protein